MSDIEKRRVVVIGGGYGGVRFIEKMVKQPNIELILIDTNPYHYLQTDVYDFIANKTNFSAIAIDLYTLCASYEGRVTFLQEEVLRIDFTNRSVHTTRSRQRYDHLIIAAGSRTSLPDKIRGLSECYHGVKSLPNAIEFKQKFEEHMFNKIETEGSCRLDSQYHVVIGGAGLSGVEIAAEMADYAKQLYKNTGYLCGGVDIILIASGKTLLPGADPFLQYKARKKLEKLGVKVIYKRRVREVTPNTVTLNDGQRLKTHFLIWTGGIVPPKIIQSLTIDKNAHGQLSVDAYYRLIDYPEVFAIGDCGALFDPKSGEVLAPTAQAAELSAEYVARNLIRHLEGKEMKRESVRLQGMFVSLGGQDGAGVIGKMVRFSGKSAFMMKKAIEKYYYYPLSRRCKKGLCIMRNF